MLLRRSRLSLRHIFGSVEGRVRTPSVSAPALRCNNFRMGTPPHTLESLCLSGRRHPKCHCSLNTVKCFCSCCCPLKILAAPMTAAKISQALPFICQQGLKIVEVTRAAECFAYMTLRNTNLRSRESICLCNNSIRRVRWRK